MTAADVDTRNTPPAEELTPEQLQAAANAEAAACEVAGGGYWSSRKCKEQRGWYDRDGNVRRCRRPGCPHHIHRFARHDATYCSGTCRMAVLRAARRAKKAAKK